MEVPNANSDLGEVHLLCVQMASVFGFFLQPIFRLFFPRKSTALVRTLAELDDQDVAYDREVTVFDSEALLVENGEVIGLTGLIQSKELIPTGGKLPSR